MFYVNLRIREQDWRWKGSLAVKNLPEPQEIIFKTDEYIEQQICEAKLQTEVNVSLYQWVRQVIFVVYVKVVKVH